MGSPRLENLPIETGQGVSVILRLFSTWAVSPKLVFFFTPEMLSKVAECLAPPKSKDEVKRFVLKDIIQKIIGLSRQDTTAATPAKELSSKIKEEILTPSMEFFLVQIGGVLRSQGDM